MTPLKNILQQFEEVLQKKASYETLTALFRKINRPPDLNEENVAQFFQIMYRLLDHQDNQEMFPGYTKGAHIRSCAFDEIEAALLRNLSPAFKFNWDLKSAEKYLAPFFQYLNRFEPNYYFEWKIFTKGCEAVQQVFASWLKEKEQKNKRPEHYVEGLKKAMELQELQEKIRNNEITWNTLKDTLLPLLDDLHFMIRAGAAKCIGLFYPDNLEYYPEGIPPFLEMLELIGKKEIEKAGVLGPFIDGYDGDCAGIYTLQRNEELQKVNFDLPSWILKILEQSGSEPGAPNGQSLEFYAHEYFEADPQSVEKLIKMGREELALEAATNTNMKIEGMEKPLNLLAKSSHHRVAANAKNYLQKHYEKIG